MFYAVKNKNRWAVLDSVARVFYYTRAGRKGAEKLAKELNKGGKNDR